MTNVFLLFFFVAPSHNTFLLFCSVNSIRYWSTDCPIHNSELLYHNPSRSSLIKKGISALTLWQLPVQTYVLWFDIWHNQLHYAPLYRSHLTKCSNLLTIDSNRSLTLTSNPNIIPLAELPNHKQEMLVRLEADNEHNLLFVANLHLSRIDIYQLDEQTLSSGKLQWITSINATSPIDMSIDQHTGTVFWIEDWEQICHFHYKKLVESNWTSTLLTKSCVGSRNGIFKPQALTLDSVNRFIIWAGTDSRLYTGSYDMKSLNQSAILFNSSQLIPSIIGVSYSNDRLYVNGNKDIQMIDLKTKRVDLVSIESSSIFDLLILNNYTISTIAPSIETTSHVITNSTTVTIVHNDIQIVNDSTEPTVKQEMPLHKQLNQHLIYTIPLSAFFVLISFILLTCICYKWLTQKNCIGHDRSFLQYCIVSCTDLATKFRKTNGRNNRPNDVDTLRRSPESDRMQLYFSDTDDEQSIQPTSNGLFNDTVNLDFGQSKPSYFQRNLVQNSSQYSVNGGMSTFNVTNRTVQNDIEDIFGNGVNPFRCQTITPNCMACRDQDICQDKGVCMATYRVL